MAWYVTAKPGDKIVCVDDQFSSSGKALLSGAVFPEKNRIYTIRHIGYSEVKGKWCLRLVEIVNPSFHIPPWLPGEPTFTASRFRPLLSRPTDISIFREMLNPAGKVLADA